MKAGGRVAWYALSVRARYEKVVARNLEARDYEVFLPLVKTRRRWSDRIKEIEIPLFPGYVLSRFDLDDRLPALMIPGVSHIVSIGNLACPIAAEEIEAVRTVVGSNHGYEPWPFLTAGQRVRVEEGPLCGLEGLVVEMRKARRLIVSLNLLKRSVAVEIERDWIVPIGESRVGAIPLSVG